MEKCIKALLLGIAAGIIDVIPMILMDIPWQAPIATLLHWLGLSIIITYARLPLPGWLSGFSLALLTGLPMATLNTALASDAFVPIAFSSAILGAVLGFMTERLINGKKH